jgi:MYXO-CTERM domain-containing protein
MNSPYDSDKVPGRDLPAPGAAALVAMAGVLSRRRRN